MGFLEGTKSRPLESDGAPTVGVDASQTLNQVPGNASGGTFVLSYQGFRTTPLAFNAANGVVEAALEALPSIGSGNIAITGGPFPAASVIASFQGSLAKVAVTQLSGDASLLTGPGAPYAIDIPSSVEGVTAFRRGSGKGALAIDVTNGVHYINTGTALEPVWTKTGVQT
jgi:hypothetical protein